jgi:hypothetical protein
MTEAFLGEPQNTAAEIALPVGRFQERSRLERTVPDWGAGSGRRRDPVDESTQASGTAQAASLYEVRVYLDTIGARMRGEQAGSGNDKPRDHLDYGIHSSTLPLHLSADLEPEACTSPHHTIEEYGLLEEAARVLLMESKG